MRQAYGPGWALVGDAGYFKDPIRRMASPMRCAMRNCWPTRLPPEPWREYAPFATRCRCRLFEVTDAIAALDWDLDQLKALHQTLNLAMKRKSSICLRLATHIATMNRGEVCMTHSRALPHGTSGTRRSHGKPSVGAAAERSRWTSMRDVEMFSEMTGDMNPLHYDAALAAGSPFGGLIVQGGVTSGLLERDRRGGPAGAGQRVPQRRVAVREGGQGRRADHRTGGGHQRARRQADLHAWRPACATARARPAWSAPPSPTRCRYVSCENLHRWTSGPSWQPGRLGWLQTASAARCTAPTLSVSSAWRSPSMWRPANAWSPQKKNSDRASANEKLRSSHAQWLTGLPRFAPSERPMLQELAMPAFWRVAFH